MNILHFILAAIIFSVRGTLRFGMASTLGPGAAGVQDTVIPFIMAGLSFKKDLYAGQFPLTIMFVHRNTDPRHREVESKE